MSRNTKYVYYVGTDYNDYIEHFEFPKINLPKIDIPKFELPKFELPKVKLPSVDVGKALNNINPFSKKGNRKDFEWKKHKWKARKRDKNGKWIYDYGDGFPGEKKKNTLGSTTVDPRKFDSRYHTPDRIDELHPIDRVAKFMEPFVGLGALLTAPSLEERAAGGKLFIGSMTEHAKDLKHAIRLFGAKRDEKTGLPLKQNKTSKEDDLDSVNPGFQTSISSQCNCPCCTVAYDLRRRGYEVVAKEDSDGATYKRIAELYKNPDVKQVVPDETDTSATDAIDKQMSKDPNGSTGYVTVQWKNGGGHIFNYEIENGHPVLYDAQSGQKLPLSAYAENCTEWHYFRTDNIEPNYESMKEFVE